MKKIFLLITVLLLITGCSTKYELVINDDLTVTEEAFLGGTSDFYSNFYKSTKKNVLSTMLDGYKEILEENGYEYELITNNNPYIYLNRKYNSILDYTQKTILLNGYFDKINYTENGNLRKIETEGYYENNPEDPNRFYIRELTISIKCPYGVTNHNAKNVNKETNTYYFELSEDNKILLEYDVSKKFDPNGDIYTAIIILLAIVVVSWFTVIVLNKKNK